MTNESGLREKIAEVIVDMTGAGTLGLTNEASIQAALPIADAVLALISPAGEVGGWQPIETAPRDGRLALVYRPLARLTSDEPVAVKRLTGGNGHCWPRTVPDGQEPCNPTDGACHVTHWMPLPAAPRGMEG